MESIRSHGSMMFLQPKHICLETHPHACDNGCWHTKDRSGVETALNVENSEATNDVAGKPWFPPMSMLVYPRRMRQNMSKSMPNTYHVRMVVTTQLRQYR